MVLEEMALSWLQDDLRDTQNSGTLGIMCSSCPLRAISTFFSSSESTRNPFMNQGFVRE